jgi:hypothetical protein
MLLRHRANMPPRMPSPLCHRNYNGGPLFGGTFRPYIYSPKFALMTPAKDRPQRPATYYRDQAEHARRKATGARPGSDMQKSWLEIADSYERLAQVAEQVERNDQV